MNGTTTITRTGNSITIKGKHQEHVITLKDSGAMVIHLMLPEEDSIFLKDYNHQNIITAINYILKEQLFYL